MVVIFMILIGLGIGASFSVLSNAAIFTVPAAAAGDGQRDAELPAFARHDDRHYRIRHYSKPLHDEQIRDIVHAWTRNSFRRALT